MLEYLFDLEYVKNPEITQTFLARGHLAPAADGIFKSWQLATYFYINAIPQWQKINNGKWKVLEELLRKKSKSFNNELTVYTGVADALTLPYMDGRMEVVHISIQNGNRVTTPKFIWKIVKYQGAAIAFVNLNSLVDGSEITALKRSDERMFLDLFGMCGRGICAESEAGGRWPIRGRTDFSDGIIVCCKADRFLQQRFPNIPNEALEESKLEDSELCKFSGLNCKKL